MRTAETNRRATRVLNTIVHKSDNVATRATSMSRRRPIEGRMGRIGVGCSCQTKWEVFLARCRGMRYLAHPSESSIVMETRIRRHSSTPFRALRARKTQLVFLHFPRCIRVRLVATCPSRRCTSPFPSRYGPFSPFLPLSRTTLNSFTRIEARTCVHRARPYTHIVHTHTIIVDQCSDAPL